MNLRRLSALMLILAFFVFFACDEESGGTDPESMVAQEQIEIQMSVMDQMVSEMASGPMLTALLQFQGISAEFFGEGFLPLVPQFSENGSLNKFSGLGRFNEIKLDTGLVAIFAVLEMLEGTHTYNAEDSIWIHTDQPENQVIFIYPYMDFSAQEHSAIINISNMVLENSNAGLNLSITIDGVTAVTMELSVAGNNFTMPFTESIMTSVNIEGTIVGQSGVTANYSVNITDTNVVMSLNSAGVSGLTLTATGSGFLSTGLSGVGDTASNVETLNIKVGEDIEFVITDVQTESGKVGDVYYNGDDVGDVVAEDDELYVEYSNGNKAAFANMMPNTFGLISLLGGIGF